MALLSKLMYVYVKSDSQSEIYEAEFYSPYLSANINKIHCKD